MDWYSGWRSPVTGDFTAIDVVLKKQVGQFPIGTEFDKAKVFFKDGELILQLINVNDKNQELYYGTYKLGYYIKEVVDEPQ